MANRKKKLELVPKEQKAGDRIKKSMQKKNSLIKLFNEHEKLTNAKIENLTNQVNRLIIQTGRDLGTLKEQGWAAWEYLWGTIEVLKDGEKLTEEEVEIGRLKVVKRWKAEKLEQVKGQLKSPQCLCEECFHLANDEHFADEEGNIRCPKCEKDMIFFAPEREDEEETPTEEKAG